MIKYRVLYYSGKKQTYELDRFTGGVAFFFVVPDWADDICDRTIRFRKRAAGAPGTIGIFVCEAVFRHASTKRSLNITANCVFASNHSRGGRFQSAAA